MTGAMQTITTEQIDMNLSRDEKSNCDKKRHWTFSGFLVLAFKFKFENEISLQKIFLCINSFSLEDKVSSPGKWVSLWVKTGIFQVNGNFVPFPSFDFFPPFLCQKSDFCGILWQSENYRTWNSPSGICNICIWKQNQYLHSAGPDRYFVLINLY